MPHISYFRLIILPRHSRKNGIVGYQSDAIVLQEDCVLYILHEIKSSHVWKPCRNETCVLSHFPIYVHHFALSTFVWENNKVVLEGSPRCPDNHDLGKCHRLYALGSLTASNLTPKNYSWQPSGTTLKDLILLQIHSLIFSFTNCLSSFMFSVTLMWQMINMWIKISNMPSEEMMSPGKNLLLYLFLSAHCRIPCYCVLCILTWNYTQIFTGKTEISSS